MLEKSLKLCYLGQHLQRNIVRGVEGFISISSKQMEIGEDRFSFSFSMPFPVLTSVFCFYAVVRKLADNCCNYGVENQGSGSALARAALSFGTSHNSMESERKNLLGALGDQVILFTSFILCDDKWSFALIAARKS